MKNNPIEDDSRWTVRGDECGHSQWHHINHGCDKWGMPPLIKDRTAMMLGLVPDKRTPEQKLEDAVATNGESLERNE